VLLVWQSEQQNEWATAIRQALTAGASAPRAPARLDAFSLADPERIRAVLGAAGFAEIALAAVEEPVSYGPDAAAAFDLVRDMSEPRQLLARLPAPAAERALVALRELLVAHDSGSGVLFDSRAWRVTARRAPP
jgi:hypothetical protein